MSSSSSSVESEPTRLLGVIRLHPLSTATLKTLHVLVKNVAKEPTNEKYLSVRLSNPKIAERLALANPDIPAAAFLEALGFVRSEDCLALTAGAFDVALFASMASTLAEIVAARSGRPLENKCLNVKTDKVRKLSKGGMSLKEQGRMQKEEQERRERESRKSSKAEILKTINTDAHARKNDPNWTSGVSAAAGKAGSSISTFRDKFGEDQGG